MSNDPYGDDPTRHYPAPSGGGGQPQPTRSCPNCGANVPQNTAFCPQCGEDLRPRKSSKAPIWIACLLAILLAAAVVLIIAKVGQHNNVTKTVTKHGASTHSQTTDRHTTTVIRTQPPRTVTRTDTVTSTGTRTGG